MSSDRRVQRTKKAIRNAFIMLISEKTLNDITIKELADAADINRNTFYTYYTGIHEVVEEIENEVVDNLKLIIGDIDISKDLNDVFRKITFVISSDLDFYSILLFNNKNSQLLQKIASMLKNKIKETILSQKLVNESYLNTMLDYSLAGIIAVYQSWFNSNRLEPISSVSQKCSDLFTCDLNLIIEKSQGKS